LAKEFGCEFYPLTEIGEIKGDCLINTTPVGMFPDMEKSPASRDVLQNFRWVMDIIYNPLENKDFERRRGGWMFDHHRRFNVCPSGSGTE